MWPLESGTFCGSHSKGESTQLSISTPSIWVVVAFVPCVTLTMNRLNNYQSLVARLKQFGTKLALRLVSPSHFLMIFAMAIGLSMQLFLHTLSLLLLQQLGIFGRTGVIKFLETSMLFARLLLAELLYICWNSPMSLLSSLVRD